ncbi:MAG: hypothetical protein K6E90_02545, partial [Lachnospiraceae bacterium]|nr:hypothetical protein [Lachnospiraceae bacterium]
MITLKAPIELKTRADFIKDSNAFSERITGNYSLLGVEIGAEELLHIVSSPPEVYIAEGNQTTIVGNTLVSSRNEEKLDIINNMLNRIMLSVNAELTYQDRAYITDALYKLGIRDDRRFMSEVRRMMNESILRDEFINDYLSVAYESENTTLREETLELSKEILERGLEEGEAARQETLSRTIMRRLQTGAIYQIVANFNKSLNETRMDLAEQLISEQENIAKMMLSQSFINNMVSAGAELVLREETEGEEPEETEEEAESGREQITAYYRSERERELLSEINTIVQQRVRSETLERETTDRAETVYREEAAAPSEEEITERVTERIGERAEYSRLSTYEKELLSETVKESSVTETIGAAVMLDIIKNLFHAEYERISRGDTWIEYRGALYHSSDNTMNRVSLNSYESAPVTRIDMINEGDIAMRLDYTEFEELSEIQENEGNIELIERQIKEMNEMNLKNVSRYEQMTNILKQLKPERRATGGKERTRRDALKALEDEKAIIESLQEGEGEQEQRRREVFTEITRLFPDSAATVFNVLEQYLNNPGSAAAANVSAVNVAQAAEELMRFQQASEQAS